MTERTNSTSDPNSEEIKTKILTWLGQFGYSVVQESHPKTEWVLAATNPKGFTLAVVLEPGRVDRVMVQSTITLPQEHQNQISSLPTDERERLLWDMRFRLLDFDVDYDGIGYPLKSVNFWRFIYSDSLTVTMLESAIVQVFKAYCVVNWMVLQKFGQ